MQPSGCCSFKPSTLTACCSASKLVAQIPFNNSIVTRKPKPSSFQFPDLKFNRHARRRNTNISSASSAAKNRLVVVKPMQKPRLVLKFIWMENNIGLALDRVIPGYGSIPLSPYYFWPRIDAWEELKVLLESKPWISQKQIVILLNQATDVINLWQQSSDKLS